MKNSILNKKYCIILGALLLGFMIIGSFYDYQISSALYNQNSTFGIFFASYGQLPAMLCFAIGGTLLIRMIDKNKKVKQVLCVLFAILLNAFAILGIAMDPMLYIENMSMIVSILIAIVIVIIVDILVYRSTLNVSKEDIKKVIILTIGVMLVEIILINIIKVPWGRPRMRMIASRTDAAFQPWWVIGSDMKNQLMALGVKSEEFKSFPSGHTANAACAMMLGVLPIINNKLKGKENMLFVIGVVFTFIVAFSRIIMGAHFLTDVTVGMSVTFIIEMLFIRMLWK